MSKSTRFEDEKYTEGISEEFPEGVIARSRGSPKQCRCKRKPDD
jgi:hypothetical protein